MKKKPAGKSKADLIRELREAQAKRIEEMKRKEKR